ncbi:MAG: hypothetical protein WAX69_09605 [Victivallales bacterium]
MKKNKGFVVRKISPEALAIDDSSGTLAFITRQGYVDWLTPGPGKVKERINCLEKETHLSLVKGLKMNLHCPHLTDAVQGKPSAEVVEGGVKVSATSRSADGNFEACYRALLSVNNRTGRYEWNFETVLRHVGKQQAKLHRDIIEFNNILPDGAFRGFLMPGRKKFDCTLMTDSMGMVWEFPHQHKMHYGVKLDQLRFSSRSMAGFFNEELNPVVEVTESPMELSWGICDMFYDLHCCARVPGPVVPGTIWKWKYVVKYLDRHESSPLLDAARRIPVGFEDFERYAAPRVELGRNNFTLPARIDRPEDVSWFLPDPGAGKTWEHCGGENGNGALVIKNTNLLENAWRIDLCPQIPAGAKVKVSVKIMTKGVSGGKGAFLRLRRAVWLWHPEPGQIFDGIAESRPVSGDTDAWMETGPIEISSPSLHGDELLWIELVLDGKGEARFGVMNIELIRKEKPK